MLLIECKKVGQYLYLAIRFYMRRSNGNHALKAFEFP